MEIIGAACFFGAGVALGVTICIVCAEWPERRNRALDSRVAALIEDESSLTHWQLIVSAALGKTDAAPPNKRK